MTVPTTASSEKVAFLRFSGFCGFYISSVMKDDTKDTHAIVWIPGNRVAVAQACATVSHFGYVRGNSNFGVRVAASDFEASYKLLRPESTFKPHLSLKFRFRVSPVPAEIHQEVWADISKKLQWDFKPIKKLSQTVWMIGAPTRPDFHDLCINNQVALIREISVRKTGVEDVLEGPRHKRVDSTSPTSSTVKPGQPNSAVDVLQTHDPWSRFGQNRTQPSSVPVATATTRQVDGPVEQRMKTQDAKIAALETQLQSRHKDTSSHFADMEKKFASDMQVLAKTIHTGVDKSIKASATHQSTQMQAMQDMLQQILQNSAGSSKSSPLKKKQKGEDEEL